MGKRLRDMTWEDYGISKHRYQELKASCLQYHWLKMLSEYREIGTVEKCREAMEKQKARDNNGCSEIFKRKEKNV